MKKKRFLLILLALVTFGPMAWAWSGSGTSSDPYLITSTADWNTLATNVNNGTTTYSDTYFKLMDNISVTTMVGGDGTSGNDKCFSGIFDGGGYTLVFDTTINVQYCAPFRRINNATVKNLKIAGEVTMTSTSSQRFVGGVVAYAKGTSHITNCINSTTITSYVNGDTGNGGIAGMVGGKGTIYITGCAFNGKMIGSDAHNWAGVIALVNSDCTANISNCLFVPSEFSVKTTGDNYTVCRATGTANISNCYYTETMNKVQSNSARAYTITGETGITVAMNGEANPIYDVSGLNFYSPGFTFNDGSTTTVYASEGDNVNLSLTAPLGYEITAATYTPECEGGSATPMNQTENVYSLPMPNANVTINAETDYCVNYWAGTGTTATDPFKIVTTDDFDMLSTLVREVPFGHPFYHENGSDQIFSGYYFILTEDLNYAGKTFNPVGYYSVSGDSRGFKGNFDGQGHVIIGINYEATTGSAGVFGFATGDISNLALVNSNLTGGNNTGGIVGYYNGGTISNCHVASDVNIYTPTGSAIVGFHGGIVGRKYAGNIYYCTSAAHIVDGCTSYGNHFGGIAGSNDSGIKSIKYCLFTNDIVTTVHTDNKGPIAGSGSGTLENCYWTNPSFEGSSPSANNDNSGFINTITVIQNKMTVASYSPAFRSLAPNGYTLQKPISEWTENPAGGWYLIASPVVGDIAPDAVVNLLGNQTQTEPTALYDYDLYRFNQSGINGEWENYHQHNAPNDPFRLVNGKGYLYARSANTTLTFTGTFNTNDEQAVELVYDQDSPHSDTRGWNLVGNPFGTAATVDKSYYRMNDGRTEIVAGSGPIAPMEGIFVQAKRVNGEETIIDGTVTFTPVTQNANSNNDALVVMNLTQDRGSVIDRAIVRFDNDNQLPKFQLFDNSTKLAIAQEGKEYAIVSAQAQSEMPVNFKAKENGQYTINVNPENVEMSYLHLIDNMTGTDIDLLQTPSYTFDAKTTDYESRFKLVFSAIGDENGDNEDAPFAYYANDEIRLLVETCHGASLQVVDVMGRVLVCRDAQRASAISTVGMTPGVYMIRLINGDNVKVQKIVVR